LIENFDIMAGITVIENNPVTKHRLEKPRKWQVIMLNDDFTPKQFVTQVLISYFNKSYEEAVAITDEIHNKGKAIAGVYPYEVSESKLSMVALAARQARLPLRAIIQPV